MMLCAPLTYAVDETPASEVEQVVEQMEIKSEEKQKKESEQKSLRPTQWSEQTEIRFLGYIVDIDSIDDASQNFEANFYIALRWKDKRLVNESGMTRQVDLNDIWSPQILVVNQQGRLNLSLPKVAKVEPDGSVTYMQRYTGKLSQPLNLAKFPIDKHRFNIHIVTPGYTLNDLKFIPDNTHGFNGGAIAETLSLPDWEVSHFEIKSEAYVPIPGVQTPGFKMSFDAERHFGYYIWQIILPLSVVIIMSWAAFWLRADQIGVRIGIGTSSVLTLIAHRFVIASLLPKLPYMTRLDYFTVGATFLVLLALIVVVVSSIFTKDPELKIARKIDIWSRIFFPSMYFTLLFVFLYFNTST